MATIPQPAARLKWQMFALSFIGLFLELMVIRWVPSVVHLVAYYANLMLLSSFLGLGAGAMIRKTKGSLFGWFPAFLGIALIIQWLCRDIVLASTAAEVRFYSLSPAFLTTLVLVAVFASNALLFVPLGQKMGELFNSLPRLEAYTWDLAGSLCGTLCFGWFSLKLFSPVIGVAVVMAIYLMLWTGPRRLLAAGMFVALLCFMIRTSDPAAIWSPYYYITVHRFETPTVHESVPPVDLLTMRNPPIYGVNVNQFGYHWDGAFDMSRYTTGTAASALVASMAEQYGLPFRMCRGRDRVLVVGAGGGSDVEVALANGAKQVDAVEIDPVIVWISRRFNAGAPYSDPRVRIHVDDARSFIARAKPGYDLVEFGYLDSQAMFSSMTNVRLDGYVYTVESLRSAFGLLNDHGILSLSFALGSDWLGPKLFRMMADATGRQPALYLRGNQMVLIAAKDASAVLPSAVLGYQRALFDYPGRLDLATDDWPYLYLRSKAIPSDYLIAIGSLLAFSAVTVFSLRRGSFGKDDLHFFFLGMGFLLLETKAIGDCTLFFGATWFVTLIVVTGVLVMVVAANLLAQRLKAFSFWMYAPLLAVLLALLMVPREQVLGLDLGWRLIWSLFAVPLPMFFAGLVFSTTFRTARVASAAFGANLLGAMAGGFSEYLGMALGNHRLTFLVMAVYLGSYLTLLGTRPPAR